jgi:hypothetical protein
VNHPVTLRFTLVPAPGAESRRGEALAYTEHRLAAGPWTKGTTLTVTREGLSTVEYRSADEYGNLEAVQSCTVRLALTPPIVRPGAAVATSRNAAARFSYRLADKLFPHLKARLLITRFGKFVAAKDLGLQPVGKRLTATWRCTLAPGTYNWRIVAADEAGNQASGSWRYLTVSAGGHSRR